MLYAVEVHILVPVVLAENTPLSPLAPTNLIEKPLEFVPVTPPVPPPFAGRSRNF